MCQRGAVCRVQVSCSLLVERVSGLGTGCRLRITFYNYLTFCQDIGRSMPVCRKTCPSLIKIS